MSIMAILAAQEGAGQTLHWWQIVGGILAIPTGLAGLISTLVLIQKTRLENAKLSKELETQKKSTAEGSPSVHYDKATIISEYRQRTIPYLLLRYIILQLVLSMWGFFSDVYGIFLEGIGMGFAFGSQKFFENMSGMNMLWIYIPYKMLASLPTLGHWIIFFGIGLPLFKDANALIGIDFKDLFSWKGLIRRWSDLRAARAASSRST